MKDEAGDLSILVLGTLQSGKTTLFRQLCGERSTELELPESSEALQRGVLKHGGQRRFVLHDTPGTSTLFPQGEEDMVARDAILHLAPDGLLLVADAKNMRRSLALVAHAAELQLPMVLAVNMEDEAYRRGIELDLPLLESQLGIDVVPTVAVQGLGVRKLRDRLKAMRTPQPIVKLPPRLETAVEKIGAHLGELPAPPRYVAGLLLARDDGAEKLASSILGPKSYRAAARLADEANQEPTIPPDVALTEALYVVAGRLADQITSLTSSRGRFLDTFGRLAHHPVIGLVIAAMVVAAMYYWVGALGATLVVDWINRVAFEDWLTPGADRLAALLPWEVARDALVDPDFGLIPTGLFLAFGLVMPVLFFFYFAFNILTASGYLPRLSILLDRLLRVIGLNGKGILPLAMSFSCITMALITVRMLDTRKERLIASFLMLLGIPCAPLLAAMLVVLGRMPVSATLVVFGFIALQILAVGALANKVLPGRASDFIMEIPPMHLPRLGRVLRQTVRQTYYFMKEAVPLFLLASLFLFGIDRVGGLDLLARIAHPVVDGLLGLPDESVQVFIKTVIRRETGAAELEHMRGAFDNVQLVITLLVMTLLTPCINSIIVLVKERGLAMAMGIVFSVSIYAVVVGAVFGGVLRLIGVTFT